jgi:hypothetical protein
MKTKRNLIRNCLLGVAIILSATAAIPCRAQPFTDALDAPGLMWTNNGMLTVGWTVGDSSVAHDGVSCAADSITANLISGMAYASSSLRTVITGPAQVSFWNKITGSSTSGSIWDVSSLSLYVDGQSVSMNICVNCVWSQSTVILASGPHLCEWIHSVSATGSYGSISSSAYLDQVVVTPINAPIITVQPQSQRVFWRNNVTFTAQPVGAAPLFYQWQLNSTNLPGATNLSLTITNVQPQNSGPYSLVASNSYGTTTSSNAILTILWFSPVLIPQSANSTNFGFNLTGSSNLVLVVEACTDLTNPVWLPVSTNTLNTFVGTNGTSYFNDSKWTNYPGRFYRLRSP